MRDQARTLSPTWSVSVDQCESVTGVVPSLSVTGVVPSLSETGVKLTA